MTGPVTEATYNGRGAVRARRVREHVSVIETTVDGRYQVIGRIATGGMGEVYRAHDAVLGREVALKVLHPQLAGDRGFVDRFRREARAAAILNHPSIVGVYDWGSTDGTYFMIMEFVRGQNLRGLLMEYERLEPLQVAEITLQVLAALEHAHGQGIVHRDIKPENILIARDGTVKVADFGLARAFADSYVSQAEGTVTGTVQYLAPEQIQGEPADPRTDLYALGVVMFELLTGNPPFSGETSLAIAYKHLSGRVPAPSRAEPAASPALDEVVLHATEKDREKRPSSARAMREEVRGRAGSLPAAPRIRELAARIPSVDLVAEERASTVTIPKAPSPGARRRRRLRLFGGLAALVLLLLGGGWAVWTYAIPHYAHVPALRGLPVGEATGRLGRLGLTAEVGPAAFSHSIPAGEVIRTSPAAGAKVRTRSSVLLIVSKGPELVSVPDVTSRPEAEAREALKRAGFQWRVKRAYDETVQEGIVIGQNPDPLTKLEKGLPVTITVSRGPEPVAVPDVRGQTEESAKATLESLGLQVETTSEFSTTVPRGEVIRTSPGAGERVPKQTVITVVVSKGPETFPIPKVVGLSAEMAKAKLEALGLVVQTVTIPGSSPELVLFQDPAEGTIVRQGSKVVLILGNP